MERLHLQDRKKRKKSFNKKTFALRVSNTCEQASSLVIRFGHKQLLVGCMVA